jgi:hypothetical protein
MTPHGLAIFVFLAFLLPVPLLAWLDRRPPGRRE